MAKINRENCELVINKAEAFRYTDEDGAKGSFEKLKVESTNPFCWFDWRTHIRFTNESLIDILMKMTEIEVVKWVKDDKPVPMIIRK